MKKFFGGLITASIVLGCAAIVSAQEGHPPMPPMPQGGGFGGGGRQMQMQAPAFSDLDKNKDKKLSKSEMPEMMANFFDRLDENKDGFVDETEWNNAMNRFRGGQGGQGGGPRFGESLLKLLDANTDSSVSSEEFAHIESLFDNLDQDKSSDLSMEELNRFNQVLFQRNNPQQNPQGNPQGGGNQQRPQMQFADLDKNKDAKLARNEMPEQMAQMFDRLDENKDSFVDEAEWKKVMNRPRLGDTMAKFMDTNADAKVSRPEFAQIKVLFAHLDKDKSGALVTDELNQFNQAANAAASEVANKATGGIDVSQLFANLDKNKDDKLTPDEVPSVKSFQALDLNKDGEVTKEEAIASLKKQAENRQKAQQKSPQQ